MAFKTFIRLGLDLICAIYLCDVYFLKTKKGITKQYVEEDSSFIGSYIVLMNQVYGED